MTLFLAYLCEILYIIATLFVNYILISRKLSVICFLCIKNWRLFVTAVMEIDTVICRLRKLLSEVQ